MTNSDHCPNDLPVGPRVIAALSIARKARLPVLLEGPTGIGKSQLIELMARQLGIEVRIIDLSLLEPSDLVGLPTVKGGRTIYAVPSVLPCSGSGILMFEELNRAEPYLQNPALQLLTARRLHEYVLPDGWMVAAAINPENGEYRVNPLDKALRDRFMVLKLTADREGWIEWAVKNDLHPAILHTARHHANLFQDVSPRSWDHASMVLFALDADGVDDGELLGDALGAVLPFEWVEVVRQTLRGGEQDRSVNPLEVLLGYTDDAQLVSYIRSLGDLGRTDVLDAVAGGVRTLLESDELGRLMEAGVFKLAELEAFQADLPGDLAELVQASFVKNPSSGQAIDLGPERALRAYRSSPMRHKVEQWLHVPGKWHRVGALMHRVAAYVRSLSPEELDPVRRRRAARKNLGQLIERVGADLAAPLTKVLEELEIVPIRPGSARP